MKLPKYGIYLLFLVFSSGIFQVQAADRIALVIGNSNYLHTTPLKNPVNDATLMAQSLESAGFEVVMALDTNLISMKRVLLEFSRRIREQNEAGLLYYAGHGMQVNGENYLVPIDAKIENEDEVPISTVRVNNFLFTMENSASDINIIIFDACRNNPFARSFRSAGGGGLAIVNAPRGSYIAYATSPGAVALDGEGNNSPFTAALADAISQPGLQIEDVFKFTRARVMEVTSDKQVPWDTTSITGKFYFNTSADVSNPTPDDAVLGQGKKKPLFSPQDWNKVSKILSKSSDDIREREAKVSWDIIGGVYDKAILKDFAKRYAGTAQAEDALKRMAKIDSILNNRLISKVGSTENTRIATLENWGVYHRDIEGGKACLSAAQPHSTDTAAIKWLFVESFVYENGKDVRQWFSINLDNVDAVQKAVLNVDGKNFPLKVRQGGLGATNILQNSAIVNALIKGAEVALNLTTKGNQNTSAKFDLKGITAALGKMDLACVTFFTD